MNNLKLFTIAFAALLIGAAAAATVTQYYYMPQQATVTSIELTFTLDGEPWTNNTLIDWGIVTAGQSYNKTLNVTNIGTAANVTVTFTHIDLPVDWTETWTGNNIIIDIGKSVTGNITLTIPLSATDGTYTWNSYIMGDA